MKTVYEMIREERLRQGLSIAQVEKKIKIKKFFLESIEEGNYKDLPSESYAIGFVKNYAQFLNLDEYKIGKMFRREFEHESQKILPNFTSKQQPLIQRLLFNSKFILASIFFLLVAVYLIFQYSSFFIPPKLSILAPKEKQRMENNIVEVRGITDPYATVKINDDETYISLDGSFKKTLYLFSGEREISIISENRYGKKSKKVVKVQIP